MRTLIITSILFFSSMISLSSQAIYRAGDISVELIGDVLSSLTVRANIFTYTSDDSGQGNSIEICWGDGECELIPRVNGPGNPPQGTLIDDNLRLNIYQGIHTYPARGTFVVSTTNCCWTEESLNILNPANTEFRLFSEYTLTNPLYQGANAQPVFLQPGLDIGQLSSSFSHTPNAFDVDGDSLAYDFLSLPEDEFVLPDQINPGPDNQISIDVTTGNINWEKPQQAGKYHLFVTVTEYRDGIPIGENLRILEIDIRDEVLAIADPLIQNWKVYPNPAREFLRLDFPTVIDQPITTRLTNAMGQVVLEENIRNRSHNFNLSGLSPGLYFLTIYSGLQNFSQPVIIY